MKMRREYAPMKQAPWLMLCCVVAGCGDDTKSNPYPLHSCDDAAITSANCVEIPAGDANALLLAANSLAPDTTIVLASGTYKMTNELSIQNVGDVHDPRPGHRRHGARLGGRHRTGQRHRRARDERLRRSGLHREELGQGRHPRRGERRRHVPQDQGDLEHARSVDQRRVRHLPREVQARARRGQRRGERVRRRPLRRPVPERDHPPQRGVRQRRGTRDREHAVRGRVRERRARQHRRPRDLRSAGQPDRRSRHSRARQPRPRQQRHQLRARRNRRRDPGRHRNVRDGVAPRRDHEQQVRAQQHRRHLDRERPHHRGRHVEVDARHVEPRVRRHGRRS